MRGGAISLMAVARMVVVAFIAFGAIRVDAAGSVAESNARILWKVEGAGALTADVGGVIVGADLQAGRLRGVDARSGRLLWLRGMPQSTECRRETVTALPNHGVLVPHGDGVEAVDATTGVERWVKSGVRDVRVVGNAVALQMEGSHELVVVDAQTGGVRWRRDCGCTLIGTTADTFVTKGGKFAPFAFHPIDGSVPAGGSRYDGTNGMDWMGKIGIAGGFLWDWTPSGVPLLTDGYWQPRNAEVQSWLSAETRGHVVDGRLILESDNGLAELDIERDSLRWKVSLPLRTQSRDWSPLLDAAGRSRGFVLVDGVLFAPVMRGDGTRALLRVNVSTGELSSVERLPTIQAENFVHAHIVNGAVVMVTANGEWLSVECATCRGGRERPLGVERATTRVSTYRSPAIGDVDVSVERTAYVVFATPPKGKLGKDDLVIVPAIPFTAALVEERTLAVSARWEYGVEYQVHARGALAQELTPEERVLLSFRVVGNAKPTSSSARDLLRRCRSATMSDEVKTQLQLRPEVWCGSLPSRFTKQGNMVRDDTLHVTWSLPTRDVVSFDEAERQCLAKGRGWRLPTVLEALSLMTPDKLHVAEPFRESHPDERAGEPSWAPERRLDETNFYRFWARWWVDQREHDTQAMIDVGHGYVEPIPTTFEPFQPPRLRYWCVRSVGK